jgi:hypothetical protein
LRTTAEIRGVYPALSQSEAEMLAAILDDYPNWAVWPMTGYPKNPTWYMRRNGTDMGEPLRCHRLTAVPRAIDGWIEAHTGDVRYAGQVSP